MTSFKKPSSTRARLAVLLLAGSALTGMPLTAYADQVWTGATSVDWYDATNWAPNGVPTSADNAVIDLTNHSTIITGGAAAANNVNIGVNNAGLLSVQAGAALTTSGDVALGSNPGSSGSLLVDTGSTLTVGGADGLIVYNGGLQIQGGSTVTSGILGIANAAAAVVDGTGSVLNATGLGLAMVGSSSLTIQNGAVLNTTDAVLGFGLTPGNPTVTITGDHSTWNGTGVLDVGTSTLNAMNGGQALFQGNSILGDGAGYTTAVTIDGSSSVFDFVQTLDIGSGGGTGNVSITNGGELFAHTLNLGIGTAGSIGTVTVDGGAFGSSGALNVGVDGTGTVTYENGADGTVDTLDIGVNAGSHGTVTLSDNPGNLFVTHAVTVGNAGTGTLTINNEGYLQGDSLIIGSASGGNGTVTVDGSIPSGVISELLINNDFAVGNASGSTGALTVSGGAFADGNIIELGVFSGATGTVTVTGSASELQSFSNIFVGEGGTGTLNILAGATVSDGFIAYVGQDQGATGTINVDGAGSILTTGANLLVGGDLVDPTGGTGFVNVTNGGMITDMSTLDLGASPGATGTMTIDGAESSVTAVIAIIGQSGTGNLTVSNGGALVAPFIDIASSVNTVGTMLVTGAGSSITASNLLQVADLGTGTLTLAGGATATAANTIIAASASGIGTLNIGAAPGSAAAAPGTLATATLTFGTGTGSLNFNHTSAAYTFAPAIIGTGTINQIAGATFLTADDSAFSGPTNITGGALHVNGSLRNSAVTVTGGGTLNGNGTVGAVTAANGGIVAPGNSIGTLNVNGNYSAAAASIYQVQLDSAGHSDLLLVSGTATIANGAILNISKTDTGAYVGGTKYTLLTAAGGVTGTYTLAGDVTQNIFASETLAYDAHDVYLNVTKVASFASAGVTPNETATGGGGDGLSTTSPLYGALLSLPSFAAARGAFDQLSGEIHASARTALVEDSRFVREAALDRLQGPNVDRPVAWGQGFGDWGSNGNNGNAATMSRSTKGFIGGVDVPVYQTWRVGFLGGFSDTDLNVRDRSSTGTSNNYHLGAYGGTQTGPVAIRVGAAYSWHDLQTARAVAFNGFSDQLTAKYDGGTTQVFGEVGYKLDTHSVSLEPFANLAYVNLNMDSFQEAGGASALNASGGATDTTFTTLGVHAKERLDLGTNAIFTAKASLGWRHAFGDIAPASANAFAGGTAFSIDGVPVAQDAAAIDAGFDAAVSDHLTVGLSYTGQFGSDAHDNGVKGNIGWKF